jgi:addiction module HigA family antidote
MELVQKRFIRLRFCLRRWLEDNMQKLELSTTIESINMSKLKNIHPGEILLEEFLIPLEITAYRLSKDIGIPQTRVSEIIKGRRRITADTALRLSIYFGNSARFWLGLQDDFDIEEETNQKKTALKAIRHFANKAA